MRVVVGCIVFAAACGGDDDAHVPAADASAAVDSASQTNLRVVWTSMPPIPGPVKNDIDVATATFRLARLQVVGDGGSGNATTLTDLELAWTTAQPSPPSVTFDAAPLGLYSQLTFDIASDATRNAFEVTGEAEVGAAMIPYRVYDTEPLSIVIDDYDVDLEPGRSATMNVRLDIRPALESVDFGSLPMIGGVLTLGPSDGQIVEVREALAEAFSNP